jgi:hypothetical protein
MRFSGSKCRRQQGNHNTTGNFRPGMIGFDWIAPFKPAKRNRVKR